MRYERSNIQSMAGYTPGKQPKGSEAIKLNTNENPYPPSPAVEQALKNIHMDSLRRYPSPRADAYRQAIAKLHNVTLEQIVAVNGGDELIRLAISTFVEPGQAIGTLEPSYSLYPVLADIHGSPVVRVDSDGDWKPKSDFAKQLNDAKCALSFLVNPHAPSGTLLSIDKISAIASEYKGVLMVDEAYVDFVDPDQKHDLVPLLAKHDNILLLRTMSKGYSLAGLRLGYGLGPANLIDPMLNKTRDSYNIDLIAQALGTASLEDQAYAKSTWNRVRSERPRVTHALEEMGCSVERSQTNFLLTTINHPTTNAKAVHKGLEERGLLVRYFALPRLDNRIRISIGTEDENHKLLTALRELLV